MPEQIVGYTNYFRSHFTSMFHSWNYISATKDRSTKLGWGIGCCQNIWNHLDHLNLSDRFNILHQAFQCGREGAEKTSNRQKAWGKHSYCMSQINLKQSALRRNKCLDIADANVAHCKNESRSVTLFICCISSVASVCISNPKREKGQILYWCKVV